MMKKIFYIFILLAWSQASAAPTCRSKFDFQKEPVQKSRFRFELQGEFTNSQKQLIEESLNQVSNIVGSIPAPEKIKIVRLSKEGVLKQGMTEGAELATDEIRLTDIALKLSPESFKGLISHELTHLVIARNFKAENEISLRDLLIKDSESGHLAAQLHTPYAEFLCDTMSVLVTGNPAVIKKMLDEMEIYFPQVLNKPLEFESPRDLSQRDFSVNPKDPRWRSYNPKDENYNAFNFLRSYVWHIWIQRLPKEKYGAFYLALQQAMSRLYSSGALMNAAYMGTERNEINDLITQYLHQQLDTDFK